MNDDFEYEICRMIRVPHPECTLPIHCQDIFELRELIEDWMDEREMRGEKPMENDETFRSIHEWASERWLQFNRDGQPESGEVLKRGSFASGEEVRPMGSVHVLSVDRLKGLSAGVAREPACGEKGCNCICCRRADGVSCCMNAWSCLCRCPDCRIAAEDYKQALHDDFDGIIVQGF